MTVEPLCPPFVQPGSWGMEISLCGSSLTSTTTHRRSIHQCSDKLHSEQKKNLERPKVMSRTKWIHYHWQSESLSFTIIHQVHSCREIYMLSSLENFWSDESWVARTRFPCQMPQGPGTCPTVGSIWGVPEMGVSQNGWFLEENHITPRMIGGAPILGNPNIIQYHPISCFVIGWSDIKWGCCIYLRSYSYLIPCLESI